MITMNQHRSIQFLIEQQWSTRRIARELNLDRRTVRKYRHRIEGGDRSVRKETAPSKLAPFQDQIREKLEQGLTAVQIFQDLSALPDFDASYPTVRRFVQQCRDQQPTVYRRMEQQPGEEAQIDFGSVGRLMYEGKPHQAYLFVMTLCWSRAAYYDLVLDQTVPTFLGCIRRAIEFFGGAPTRLKPDNLRSAVLFDQLKQRYYQDDFFRFCRHYGAIPDAARPGTPTDKGRAERDIRYCKGNFFRGRSFEDYHTARAQLFHWRDHVANPRLHNTTQRQPDAMLEQERAFLTPLPEEPFEIAWWGEYRVRKDIHIRVGHNDYSVPYQWSGHRVFVRVNEDTMRIFAPAQDADDPSLLAEHARLHGRGGVQTDHAHYPGHKRVATQEIHRRRVTTVREAGPHASAFLTTLSADRWVYTEQLAHLARLVEQHGDHAVELACRRAHHFGATGAATIDNILAQRLQDQPLPVDDPPSDDTARSTSDDFGRPLSEYGTLLPNTEYA